MARILTGIQSTGTPHLGNIMGAIIPSIEISKEQQSSNWGSKIISKKQKSYAANDVLYLHKIKDKLDNMLLRENRIKLAKACFDFIQYRTDLDISGWSEQDIFKH